MMPVLADAMTLPMALALGLLFGMGPCLVGCFPYLGPVYLAMDGGINRSLPILLPLSMGRLSAYTGFGMAAGMAGNLVSGSVGNQTIWLISGIASILVGLSLFLKPTTKSCSGRSACTPKHGVSALFPSGLFLMGYAMALTPCGPLTAILAAAAASASLVHGAGLGLAFGLGAIIAPAIVFGIGLSFASEQLRKKLGGARKYAEWASAGLLLMNGMVNLWRWGI